jgi:hypothetical protein
MKLFMVLIGCKPEGRHTEQHDIFFGIAQTLADLVPQLKSFWPGKNSQHNNCFFSTSVVTAGENLKNTTTNYWK